jgi:dUTP pyrophosphatase
MFIVKKLSDQATLPTRGSELAVGYDLSASAETVIPARGKGLVQTGLKMKIPVGHYGRIAPRSGLALNHFIDVGAGVIDPDYRGPVGIVLFNHGEKDFHVKVGDRVAQLILEMVSTPVCNEVESFEEEAETKRGRGEGGFGSTGK